MTEWTGIRWTWKESRSKVRIRKKGMELTENRHRIRIRKGARSLRIPFRKLNRPDPRRITAPMTARPARAPETGIPT